MKSAILIGALAWLALVAPTSAHVGSPDVYYEGMAGPYRLFVTVRVPQMIPGIAEVEVRALQGSVSAVDIVPLRVIGEGSQNAPPPDRMTQSKSDPQFFTGRLWLMESGSWQIRMNVFGSEGKGEMAVPVAAFAQRTLRMQKVTGTILFALMVFLVLSFISIFGAAVRESQSEPGIAPTPEKRRRGRIAMGVSALAAVAIVLLGNAWWDSEASDKNTGMLYKAPPIGASLDAKRTLELKLGFSSWHDNRKQMQLVKIIPDHGHLMHLFLLRLPEMDRFYHLHPEEKDADTFTESIPFTDPGQFALFADIVRESGFPDTMTGRLSVPADPGGASSFLSGDDSAASAPTLSAAEHKATVPLEDGAQVEWLSGQSLEAQKPLLLRFRVLGKNGQSANDLEPYMGMAGHLVIVRRDLTVFAHVHPAGSVPMAALALLQKMATDGSNSMAGMHNDSALPAEITFPYGFPQAGDYRLFLQVKRAGRVQTAVFDLHVKA